MATRNIVPRATGEGQIGTSAKTWSAVYADDIAVTNGVTASTFAGDLTGDVTGDVTGTASGNLPLSGGTMTGEIIFNGLDAHDGDSAIQCSTDDDGVRITGASAKDNGASVILYGKDSTNSAGCFIHTARDGVNTVELKGNPNGNLKWNNEDVLTSSFITTISVTVTGSVAANNWGDYTGTITYPAGYSHALSLRDLALPSPSNQYLINWTLSDTTVKIRLFSKAAYTNQSFNVAISVTK